MHAYSHTVTPLATAISRSMAVQARDRDKVEGSSQK